jgi:transmembrane sensor
VKSKHDDRALAAALETLRDHPVVSESRAYAHQWELSRVRRTWPHRVMPSAVGGIAAVCAVACVLFLLEPLLTRSVIETGVGETRTLTLDDGSRVVLDTRSRVHVAFTTAAREVQLLDGRAHFEVAQNANRPFRVRTKSAEVVAVGTMFDVLSLAGSTRVTLIEGRVNVRTIPDTPHEESTTRSLLPGQQLGIAGDGRLLDEKTVEVETATAWERGTVVLDDVPVSEALADMNRYSRTQIVIEAAAVQSQRISGVFRAGDVETEAIALERYFGLEESSRSAQAIVLRPKE